mgnify:CR=1 FL=1
MKKLTLKKEVIERLDASRLTSIIGGGNGDPDTTTVIGDSGGTNCKSHCDFCPQPTVATKTILETQTCQSCKSCNSCN